MPELPEVETVRRGLAELIVGRTVQSAEAATSPKSFPNSPGDTAAFLAGASVVAVRRRAKVLLIDFDSGYTLVTHLKMTGQLVFVSSSATAHSSDGMVSARESRGEPRESHTAQPKGLMPSEKSAAAVSSDIRFGAGHPNESLIGALPDASTRVIIVFTDGSHLFFNDQRKFGWMKLFPTIEVPNISFMQKVGPEPLEDAFTADIFYERLQRRKNTTIKAAILDQTVLAGVGNIYADEGLWGAKIHPAARVRDVPREKIDALWRELREVMTLAIEKGGSTNKNYVNAEGKRGSYMDFARVFRREGLPCPRHPDVLIEKIRVAGRGTHVCPVCQEIPS